MKKQTIIAVLIMIVFGLIYFGYQTIQEQIIKKEIERNAQKMPSLSFYALNQTIFNYNNVKKNSTLIIYFHPECEHCQYEAKELLENKEHFSKVSILMVSPAPLIQIKQFNTEYHLDKISTLKVLWDKERKFKSYFGTSIFPTVLIYNNKNRLQKKYKGEVKIEAILKHLEASKTNNLDKQTLLSASNHQYNNFKIELFLFDLGL